MKRSLLIVLCLVIVSLLVLSGCDESLRAEMDDFYGNSADAVQIAQADTDDAAQVSADMTVLDAADAAESAEAGIDSTDIFAGEKKAKEKVDPRSLISKKTDEKTEEEELTEEEAVEEEAAQAEDAYYGIRWDMPDEMEIETLPEGYDQVTIRDNKILSSLEYPVFTDDEETQYIAYGRLLDEKGRDTDKSGWYVFSYSDDLLMRDPDADELEDNPVPEGYALTGEASDLPKMLGFGLYEYAEEYEEGDAGLDEEETDMTAADDADIAPETAFDLQYYAFGDKYDPETGEITDTGWFAVSLEKTELDEDSVPYLLEGQIVVCQSDEEYLFLTVGEDDRDIMEAAESGEWDEMYVVSVALSDEEEIKAEEEPELEFVVDVPGYSYQEPVYQTRWVQVCDECGKEIKGNVDAHMLEEIEAGGEGSYHNEPRQVKVGVRTVDVPDAGHYEAE